LIIKNKRHLPLVFFEVYNVITKELERAAKPPYLFVGSGFSRRYLEIPTWEDFLSSFSEKKFVLYKGKASGSLPAAAGFLADDIFEDLYKNSEKYNDFISRYADVISLNKDNALKCRISERLIFDVKTKGASLHENEELKILAQANIDGIITTNWDLAIESIFPKFVTFIGQEELLFKSIFGVGEIYKIHGCCTQPASLVLTSNDYEKFENRQSYVAAKLATIFVEHPVIFIGYSLSDEYLISVLAEISRGLGDRREKLSDNLFFVRRPTAGEQPHKTKTTMQIGGHTIPITLVVTNDYSEIYKSLASIERKIPAHVLRVLREQLYKATESAEPEKQVKIVDIDDEDNLEKIEFVAGFAVRERFEESMQKVGLTGINRDALFQDFLFDTIDAEPIDIVREAIPNIRKGRVHAPIFKYLRAAGFSSDESFRKANINIGKPLPARDSFIADDWYGRSAEGRSASQILSTEQTRPEFAAQILLGLDYEKFTEELPVIEKFINENYKKLHCGTYKSAFCKLVCYFDMVKYGWN
jgi:hypothetical protein